MKPSMARHQHSDLPHSKGASSWGRMMSTIRSISRRDHPEPEARPERQLNKSGKPGVREVANPPKEAWRTLRESNPSFQIENLTS